MTGKKRDEKSKGKGHEKVEGGAFILSKKTLELDEYESGVIFHALKDERNQMIEENRPTDAVDDVLLKVIHLIEKPSGKKPFGKKQRGHRNREER